MNIIKVKVFDAYKALEHLEYYKELGISDYNLFEYHNQIINKKGLIKPETGFFKKLQPIKPLDEDLIKKDKYELDNDEKMTLKMLKDSTKQAKDLYDSCKRKQHKYENILLNKIDKDFYDGDRWDCSLSPLGYCLYSEDECGEPRCIFCGEPEERK